MAGPKAPLDFCNDMPDFKFGADARISLVFGLPEITFNADCQGINQSVPSINLALSGIFPIIRLAECVLKVIEVVKAIPDTVGPPPNPTKIIKKISELAGCITLLLEFSGFGAIPAFCKMLRDIVRFCIAVLECLKVAMTVSITAGEELELLNASADLSLNEMGSCMAVQNAALEAQLNARIDGLGAVISMLNILFAALPPPISDIAPIPDLTPPIEISNAGTAALDDAITALQVVETALDACAL